MKKTLIAMLAVLAICVLTCLWSLLTLRQACLSADEARLRVLERYETGELSGAREELSGLAAQWNRKKRLLEAISPHEGLHEMIVRLIEADAALRAGDLDDFEIAMALMGETLRHICEEERLTLENLF